MQQESWGVLGLEFVDERAERALGFILAERAERVFRVCFGWARWARARFCGKAKQVKEGVLCTEAQSISAKVSVCSRFLRFHCSFGVGDCWIKSSLKHLWNMHCQGPQLDLICKLCYAMLSRVKSSYAMVLLWNYYYYYYYILLLLLLQYYHYSIVLHDEEQNICDDSCTLNTILWYDMMMMMLMMMMMMMMMWYVMWSSEKRLQAAQSYLWEVVFEIALSGSKRFRAFCWTQLRNSSKRL